MAWNAVEVTQNVLPLDRPARIGVTSGASTPDSVVHECLEALTMVKKLQSQAADEPSAAPEPAEPEPEEAPAPASDVVDPDADKFGRHKVYRDAHFWTREMPQVRRGFQMHHNITRITT